MKSKFLHVVSVVMLSAIVFSNSVFATTNTVYLDTNQDWTNVDSSISRSKVNAFIDCKLKAVYPSNGGSDNYTRVWVQVTTPTFSAIGPEKKLNETASSFSQITIYNGYLDLPTVGIRAKGNDPDLDAWCELEYNGR